MTDTELMMRVKAGDQSAFKAIVERYQRRVINVGYRFLGNREDAEDVAQETFLKVYLSAKSYKPRAKLFTYLYTIVTRLALNRLRKKKRLRWFSLDQLERNGEVGIGQEVPADPADQPDQSLERAEREAIVRRALDALPAAQKTAVILSRYEGLSYKQIAEVMELSVSAVESKLHRAKQTLRKKLNAYSGDI
jgi:RNA polymerase sigma-70 factor (ECF subfamily)